MAAKLGYLVGEQEIAARRALGDRAFDALSAHAERLNQLTIAEAEARIENLLAEAMLTRARAALIQAQADEMLRTRS